MKSKWFWRAMEYPERLDYYQTRYEPWLPPQHQWRMLLFLIDGKGRKLRLRRNGKPESSLREMLIRFLPDQAYYRTHSFLNCDRVKKRSNGDRYLGGDLVFDIDMPTIREARGETLKLLDYLEERDYPEPSIRFSGRRGYHVVIER